MTTKYNYATTSGLDVFDWDALRACGWEGEPAGHGFSKGDMRTLPLAVWIACYAPDQLPKAIPLYKNTGAVLWCAIDILADMDDQSSTYKEEEKQARIQAVRSLLPYVSLNNRLDETPLITCVMRAPDVILDILKFGADINECTQSGKFPPITALAAAACQRPEHVKLLIKHGAALDQLIGPDQNTALHVALLVSVGGTEHDPKPGLRILLEHGADPNLQNAHGTTPLMKAVENRSVDGVLALLEHRAKWDIPDLTGNTPHSLAKSLASQYQHGARWDVPALVKIDHLIQERVDAQNLKSDMVRHMNKKPSVAPVKKL